MGENDNIGGGKGRKDKFLLRNDRILETEFLKGGIMVRLRRKFKENKRIME